MSQNTVKSIKNNIAFVLNKLFWGCGEIIEGSWVLKILTQS